MNPFWTPSRDKLLRELVASYAPRRPDFEAIALQVGTTKKAAGVRWSRIRDKQPILEHTLSPKTEDKVNDSISYASPLSTQPLTEAQALELFAVDLTRWEPVKLTHNVWMQGSTGPDGELLHQNLYQTTLHLKRIVGAEGLIALTDTLLQSLKDAAPPRGPFVITRTKAQHLLELDPVDLHWGKLGWDAETESENYDISIATRDFKAATDDLLGKVGGFPLAEALIVVGNDLLHTDNLKSETTSGTRVDSDSRYHRSFDAATEAMRWAIERAKQVAPQVKVVVVPGNHDRLGAFTVGRVLEAIYQSDPRVAFDNRPPLRKYVRWGKTLLGFTHGSEEKMADLPLIMAQERPEDWAQTLYRGWRIGHFHKRKQTKFTAGDSFQGVEVRVVRSLSGTDAWHYSKGFIKERRGVEAFVHHSEDGEVGAFLSRLPHPDHITRDNARTV